MLFQNNDSWQKAPIFREFSRLNMIPVLVLNFGLLELLYIFSQLAHFKNSAFLSPFPVKMTVETLASEFYEAITEKDFDKSRTLAVELNEFSEIGLALDVNIVFLALQVFSEEEDELQPFCQLLEKCLANASFPTILDRFSVRKKSYISLIISF